MPLLGYHSSNHPQQTAKRGPKPEIDDRATAPEVFDPLNKRFRFTLDVAASPTNAKCNTYITLADDGLVQPWVGRIWCNPPYSDIEPWIDKAWTEWEDGRPEVIAMLLPANRTEQGWWQDLIEPYRDGLGPDLKIEFLRGRMRFIRMGADTIGPNERPPFGCCLAIWTRP